MKQIQFIFPVTLIIVCFAVSNSYAQSLQTQTGKQPMAQSKQSKYGLHGKLKTKEGKVDELVSILLKASKLVSTARGCHLYIVSKDIEDETIIWVTEVWESKEDHDNSLQIEGVRELISKAMPLIDGQPEKGIEFEVIGGAGLQ